MKLEYGPTAATLLQRIRNGVFWFGSSAATRPMHNNVNASAICFQEFLVRGFYTIRSRLELRSVLAITAAHDHGRSQIIVYTNRTYNRQMPPYTSKHIMFCKLYTVQLFTNI